jgi:8-oxo-dGTP pyrophosphatase MutT (NUDIX family)
MLRKWKPVRSECIQHFRVFDLLRETYISPRTGHQYPFYVLQTWDWTNIIPITPDNNVVMIQQFRAGIRSFTLEIPGGLVEPEDRSPLDAARRELREETGYDSDDFIPLGVVHPNPSILNNQCHSFLAKNVCLTGEQVLDQGEDIAVQLVPLEQVPELILGGQITHGLVLNAFQWYMNHSS